MIIKPQDKYQTNSTTNLDWVSNFTASIGHLYSLHCIHNLHKLQTKINFTTENNTDLQLRQEKSIKNSS